MLYIGLVFEKGRCGNHKKIFVYPKSCGNHGNQLHFRPDWKNPGWGWSDAGFLTGIAVGGITGGVASAWFYGAGKGIEKLKAGFRAGKGGFNSMNKSRTPEEAGISVSDSRRIQNAATRTNQDIVVVGSQANGTATPTSDWNYYMTGKSSQRHSSASSLPRGTSGGEINYLGGDSGIDIFVGYSNSPDYEPLKTDNPHVIFKP